MKEFAVYTALRLILFLATFGLVAGVWMLVADEINVFLALIIALLISGIASFFMLNRQRSAFATRVEERAERVSSAFEEHKAREDAEAAAAEGADGTAPEGDQKA
ncbi:MAG: DUF4229 domain-containing protein [Nocardioides sp.]|uniref:DUF4229 domain-containing protein n=1 Tax=Nocardioides sp. TaxID=35761 RepID=UPI003F0121E8